MMMVMMIVMMMMVMMVCGEGLSEPVRVSNTMVMTMAVMPMIIMLYIYVDPVDVFCLRRGERLREES